MLKHLLLFFACSAVTATSSALMALEVVGAAPYLENRYRAEWRSTPLSTVLKEVEKQTAPVVPSGGLLKISDSQLVTLIDINKVRLRDTLELLERTQDLRVTAEPLRLFIETRNEFRDRKRHLVNLALRDYGMFVTPRNFHSPRLGYLGLRNVPRTGSLFPDDRNDHSAGDAPNPELVVVWLQELVGDSAAELGRNGNVYLKVTDEEEATIRAVLELVQQRLLQRSNWQVSFGTLPAGQPLITGFATPAEAQAIIPRLQSLRTLTLSAMNGQRTHSVDGRQESLIGGIDVVNYQFDPAITVLTTGIAAELRPSIGSVFHHVAYELSWVDPLPAAISEVSNPARLKPGSSTTTTTTTTTPEEKSAPRDTKSDVQEKPTTTTLTTNNTTEVGDTRPGVTIPITKPVLWTWIPRGEVMLPKDRAMVLATEHPAGIAVMILEVRP